MGVDVTGFPTTPAEATHEPTAFSPMQHLERKESQQDTLDGDGLRREVIEVIGPFATTHHVPGHPLEREKRREKKKPR